MASATAAPSATISRSLRLRAGSIPADSGRRAVGKRPARPGAQAPRCLTLARVALAGPGRQQQDQPCVALRPHLVALLGLEVGQKPGAAAGGLAVLVDLDLARGHH